MFRIPPELVDAIIDELHNDRASLATCSLASSSWTPRARYHLFRTIALRSERSFRQFQALLDLTPKIALYPRNLFINESWNSYEFRSCQGKAGSLAERPWVADAIELLGPRLASVRSLRIMLHPHLLTDRFGIRGMLNQHFMHVSELLLADCAFTAPEHLLQCIEARPRLRLLSLSHVYSAAPVDAALRLPNLEHLEIDCKSCSHMVLAWLLHEPENLRRLRVLQLTNICGDGDLIPRFLAQVGPSLQHLQLQIGYGWRELCDRLSLPVCSQLQSVMIDISIAEPGGPSLCQLLGTLRAPKLRRLTIKLSYLKIAAKIRNLDWHLMRQALGGLEFSELREIRVVTNRHLRRLGELAAEGYVRKATTMTSVGRLLRFTSEDAFTWEER